MSDQTPETPTETPTPEVNRAAQAVARAIVYAIQVLLPVLAVVGSALVCWWMGTSVYDLSRVHFQNTEEVSQLAALLTVGTPILLALYLMTFKGATVASQGIATLFMVIWLFIAVILSFYDAALKVQLLAVPTDLMNLGEFIFAGLSGLTLFPALLVPLITIRAPANAYPTVVVAISSYFGAVVQIAAIIAGVTAEFYFGFTNNMPPMFAGFASLIVGLSFVWAAGRIKDAAFRNDVFDLAAWRAVIVVFGAYLVLISGEAVQTFAGWSFMPDWLHTFNKVTYSYALAVFLVVDVVVTMVTHRVDDIRSPDAPDGWAVRPPLHERVSAAALGWRKAYRDLKGETVPPSHQVSPPATKGWEKAFADLVLAGRPPADHVLTADKSQHLRDYVRANRAAYSEDDYRRLMAYTSPARRPPERPKV